MRPRDASAGRAARRRPLNPVLQESLQGIATSGQAHLDHLLYLFLQAVVLFIWWPKDTLFEALSAGDRPDTLLASVIALGVASAWYAARAGGEEILLPGQAGIGAWTLDTTLPLSRIVSGYLGGHLVQTLGLVGLSAPLVLSGFGVSGGRFDALGWCLMAVVFQATFFRLVAAAIHLAIGQQQTMTLVCVRGAVVVGYIAGITLVPAASHVMLSRSLLNAPDVATGLSHPGLQFLLWMTLGSTAAAYVVVRQLRRLRSRSEAAA